MALDDIAVIAPYFNFIGHQNIIDNVHRFRDRLRYPVQIVEASLTGRFFAATESTDIRLHAPVRSILFQRNRLINIAISKLPSTVKYVAWLDADIQFDSDDWLDRAREALESHEVVQLFTTAESLGPTGDIARRRPAWATLPHGKAGNEIWESSRGYAWAARLSALPKLPLELGDIGLLDRQMLSEDTIMAMYWAGYGLGGDIRKIGHAMVMYCDEWAGQRPKKTMTAIAGGVTHFYHGSYHSLHEADRQYLQDTGYEPMRDLQIEPNGLYSWTAARDRNVVYFLESMRRRMCDDNQPFIGGSAKCSFSTPQSPIPAPIV